MSFNINTNYDNINNEDFINHLKNVHNIENSDNWNDLTNISKKNIINKYYNNEENENNFNNDNNDEDDYKEYYIKELNKKFNINKKLIIIIVNNEDKDFLDDLLEQKDTTNFFNLLKKRWKRKGKKWFKKEEYEENNNNIEIKNNNKKQRGNILINKNLKELTEFFLKSNKKTDNYDKLIKIVKNFKNQNKFKNIKNYYKNLNKNDKNNSNLNKNVNRNKKLKLQTKDLIIRDENGNNIFKIYRKKRNIEEINDENLNLIKKECKKMMFLNFFKKLSNLDNNFHLEKDNGLFVKFNSENQIYNNPYTEIIQNSFNKFVNSNNKEIIYSKINSFKNKCSQNNVCPKKKLLSSFNRQGIKFSLGSFYLGSKLDSSLYNNINKKVLIPIYVRIDTNKSKDKYAYLYYTNKKLYLINFSDLYMQNELENFIKRSLENTLVYQKFDISFVTTFNIPCGVKLLNKNIIRCLCAGYYLFLSIINKDIDFNNIKDIINEYNFELKLFLLFVKQFK